MAYHKIYRYTGVGRPLTPTSTENRTVLMLMPAGGVLGAVTAWMAGQSAIEIFQQAFSFLLLIYLAWALARELNPDDRIAAFISMAACMLAAVAIDSPGILIVITTLGLVRTVNRSSGLVARKSDSIIILLLVITVMYATESPFFGVVAAAAYILDGMLKEPLRHQWIFGLVCLAATVVYMVDHKIGFTGLSAPDSLFEWLAVLFLLIFALNMLLLNAVYSKADATGKKLDLSRVRGGMAVGLLAALQGITRPDTVVIIVAVIAGIGIGMAFRKGFRAPASG